MQLLPKGSFTVIALIYCWELDFKIQELKQHPLNVMMLSHLMNSSPLPLQAVIMSGRAAV